MARKGDFGEIPGKTQAATKGVNALSNAFGDLSKKGEVSAASINQVAGSLAMVNPVLGLVAASVGAVVSSFQMLEELDAKETLENFGVGASAASRDFERFAAVTVAGAGSSDRLMEAQKRLADSQFSLKEKSSLLNVEIARQAKLVAGHPELEQAAANAVEVYKNKLEEQFEARARIVDGIQVQIEHIKAEEAATKRNTKAVADYNDSVAKEEALFRVQVEGRRSAGSAKEREVKQLEMIVGQYERKLAIELETNSADAAGTLENISNAQNRIDALELEIETQDRLGQMAARSIGGVGAAAFDRYADAIDRVIDGQNAFSKSSGRALQNATSEILKQVGREAAVYAIMETAKGIAASTGPAGVAAFGDPGGHFAAAATFAAVAAAAGVGAGALSVKGGGGSGSGSGRDDGSGASGGRVVNLTVVEIGVLDTESRKRLGAQLREEILEGGG